MTFSDETIQEIVGIFETNSIEIRLQQSEINGLYEIGSMMEHSCCPNVRMSFDDKFNVSLYCILIVDVLCRQPIKLFQVVSTSEFHEY